MSEHLTLTKKIDKWNLFIEKEIRKIMKSKIVPIKIFQNRNER